ncbi:FHA domain-containing protein [Paenibacillus sp. T3-5-0-4]|nr:FHA domain-containing protein [Paenibacillus endoradicis]
MKHLKIDYTMNNGHQMTIERTDPFTSRDMNALEMNMLSANIVHTFLPFDWNEIDNEIVFVYRIQHFKLLTHFYQPGSIKMIDYYSLLLSLLDALVTCYDYMLRPQCCLLDEKLIYFDPTNNSIRLVYLPVQEQYHKEDHQLLLLAVRWSQLVDSLHYEGYQKILQLIGSQHFPIIPLRQLLLDLIHQLSSNSQEGLQTPYIEKVKPGSVLYYVQNESEQSSEQSSIGFVRSENDEGYDDWEDEAESKPLGWKHYAVILLIITIVGLSWKNLYFEDATTTNFLFSCGITLIMLTGIVIVLKQHWKVLSYKKRDYQQENLSLATNPNQSIYPSQPSLIEQPVKSNLEVKPLHNNEQVRVAPPQATVKLDQEHSTTALASNRSNGTPSLLRKLFDDEQRIIVNDNRFLIGRAEEGVHYQDDASGVSRVHLEVEVDNGSIHIKDVGSRNGSYLNGQLMIAYKAYPLYEGDIIQLVNNEGPKYQLAV